MLSSVLSLPDYPEFPGFDPNQSFDANASAGYHVYLSPGTTYVITKDHCLGTVDLEIPSDVTLCFMGGKLLLNPLFDPNLSDRSGGGVLKGNSTRIIAPIDQIFDASLKVEGTWMIDRAYPQWFGAKNDAFTDCADAINKTIIMKQTGEVFIPRGKYVVKKTIFVKFGIDLTGESGRNDSVVENQSTILYADTNVSGENPSVESTNFMNGYFMMININQDLLPGSMRWKVNNPIPSNNVKNIYFRNNRKIRRLKGIYSLGNVHVHNCTWEYFQQAFYGGSDYVDQRKVTRCTFNDPGNFHKINADDADNILYAFDMGRLGDALVFENNAIHDGTYNHGLKLNVCYGGSITSNVINADVLITDCKAVTYKSNHMEGEPQIKIENSNVDFSNNYIWKGSRPSLVIVRNPAYIDQRSIVNISGNLFFFRERTVIVGTTNEFDIQTDALGVINISDTYRYWIESEGSKMYSYGINICYADGTSFERFNKYSYLYSKSSRIISPVKIENTHSKTELGQMKFNFNNASEGLWQGEGIGTFYYKYQIMWDLDRQIGTPVLDVESIKESGFTVGAKKNGILFILYNGDSVGYNGMVRLFRGNSKVNFTHYVDIPVCGIHYLFENGISICGFKWKEIAANGQEMLTGNPQIDSIQYTDNNVICRGNSVPGAGVWKKGDIVYNTSSNSNTSMWVYLSTGWVAR